MFSKKKQLQLIDKYSAVHNYYIDNSKTTCQISIKYNGTTRQVPPFEWEKNHQKVMNQYK